MAKRVTQKLKSEIAKQVAELADMDLGALRQVWEVQYGTPPKLRSVDMLKRILAWRIQADTFGGVDAATIRMLGTDLALQRLAEQPGTRLARNYGGKRHEVVMVEDGVAYEGKRYNSLSEVARVITGQRWNGPRFFGLRSGAVERGASVQKHVCSQELLCGNVQRDDNRQEKC